MLGGGLGSQGRYSYTLNMNTGVNYPYSTTTLFNDDFVGSSVNEYIWKKNGAGTQTISSNPTGVGAVQIQTGAVINQDSYLNFNNVLSLPPCGARRPEYEFGGVYVNSTADAIYRIGIMQSATRYIYLECDITTRGNANWWLCRQDNAGETATDTGIAVSTSSTSMNVWRIVSPIGTSYTFNLYHKILNRDASPSSFTLIGNYTTVVPSGYLEFYLYSKTNANSNKILTVDYVSCTTNRIGYS